MGEQSPEQRPVINNIKPIRPIAPEHTLVGKGQVTRSVLCA